MRKLNGYEESKLFDLLGHEIVIEAIGTSEANQSKETVLLEAQTLGSGIVTIRLEFDNTIKWPPQKDESNG